MSHHKDRYKLRMIVVEDEQRISNSIVNKITNCIPDCDVVATATNGNEALQLIDEHHPNIVMSDIKMPMMDGLDLSRVIKEKYPNLYVVILSGFSNFSFAQQAIKFGVFNYLLKPLSEDNLIETIEEIRTKIEEENKRQTNKIWLSRAIQANMQDISQLSDENDYFVFSINFFNLCYDSKDDTLLNNYFKLLKHIDWDTVLKDFDNCKWFVVDDYVCNKKNIIFSLESEFSKEAAEMVAIVLDNLKKYYGDLSINLCYHKQRIKRNAIWTYSKRLRYVLENTVIPTKPQVYILEKDEKPENNTLYDIACLQIKKIAKPLVRQFKYIELNTELNSIFDYLLSKQVSQRQLYKVTVYIVKFLEYSFENENKKLKQDFFRKLSISQNIAEIRDAFKKLLDAWLLQSYENTDDDKIKQEVVRYVDENYANINSLEEVAKVFNYNYTYLSRMFKSITGTTLIKYITNKRIEAAKQIMQEHPEIAVNLVGEKVGYSDQRYFSRTFKVLTEMSPSEYKSSLK